MLSPQQLITLNAVIKAGSFALAADELGYTGSAVSQQMSALERQTGLSLFEREPRGVRPTAVAVELASRAESMLAELDALERHARDLSSGERGTLRIGSFPTASARLVPHAVSRFLERTPGAEITLDEAEPQELIPRLVDGQIDFAIIYEYDHVPCEVAPSVVATPLLTDQLLLLEPGNEVAQRGHRGGDEEPRLLAHRHRSFVAPLRSAAGALFLERLCAPVGFTPNVAFRSNDYEVIAGFVAAGLGVAVVPALAATPRPGVVATPLTARRHVKAAYRASNRQPLREAFLGDLRAATQRYLQAAT
jgi:DNA-binding transcriptional LysR family regulator